MLPSSTSRRTPCRRLSARAGNSRAASRRNRVFRFRYTTPMRGSEAIQPAPFECPNPVCVAQSPSPASIPNCAIWLSTHSHSWRMTQYVVHTAPTRAKSSIGFRTAQGVLIFCEAPSNLQVAQFGCEASATHEAVPIKAAAWVGLSARRDFIMSGHPDNGRIGIQQPT